MPLLPKVPHIVGDDDDDSDDNNEVQLQLQNAMKQSARKREECSSDEDDSDDSFEDGSSDDDDDDVSSSEIEDCAIGVCRAAPTPQRQPTPIAILDDEQLFGTSTTNFSPINLDEFELELVSTKVNAGKDEEPPVDIPTPTPETELAATTIKVEPIQVGELEEAQPEVDALELLKSCAVPEPEPPIEPPKDETLPPPKEAIQPARKPLRSTARIKSALTPFRLSEASKSETPATIGGRVAKRRSCSLAAAKRGPPTLGLAKPLEVTKYFNKLSATLVRQRVCQLPFQSLRDRIDRLVKEALIQTQLEQSI